MKILVIAKLVPDLVEELELDDSGTSLDTTWVRLIINELDDHAIEQGILLKERYGAEVVVLAPDAEGIDDILYTASAKGADSVHKVLGDFESGVNNHALARIFATLVKDMAPDLILTGVQSHEDTDGSLGALLAGYLDFPYIGYVAKVNLNDNDALVGKEYPGGLIAEMEVSLPAVLGIQAAEQPPRYVAVSKVRQAMKTAAIEEHEIMDIDLHGGPVIDRMYFPEVGEGATIIEGDLDEVVDQLISLFNELGVL